MENHRFGFLVIDMMNDFFDQHPELSACRRQLVAGINQLARAFREHQQSVIWIRGEFAPDLSDGFPEMRRRGIRVAIAGTNGCQILSDLDRAETDRVIVKKRYSAFFGTNLDSTLETLQPKTLVVSGINTHACVRTTIIDAYQRDYDVVVASDCIASYDQEHHDVTRRYLDGKMARFLGNAEILSLLTSKGAV